MIVRPIFTHILISFIVTIYHWIDEITQEGRTLKRGFLDLKFTGIARVVMKHFIVCCKNFLLLLLLLLTVKQVYARY